MAGCELDFSSLPILTGCPGDSETFLVGNAVGGLDVNGMPTVGYARRMWGDMRKCAAQGLRFIFNQFKIGSGGSPMNDGDDTLIINLAPGSVILQQSVFITLGGPELPQEDDTQLSYGVVYNSATQFTINFLAPVSNNQLYILHYAYSS